MSVRGSQRRVHHLVLQPRGPVGWAGEPSAPQGQSGACTHPDIHTHTQERHSPASPDALRDAEPCSLRTVEIRCDRPPCSLFTTRRCRTMLSLPGCPAATRRTVRVAFCCAVALCACVCVCVCVCAGVVSVCLRVWVLSQHGPLPLSAVVGARVSQRGLSARLARFACRSAACFAPFSLVAWHFGIQRSACRLCAPSDHVISCNPSRPPTPPRVFLLPAANPAAIIPEGKFYDGSHQGYAFDHKY